MFKKRERKYQKIKFHSIENHKSKTRLIYLIYFLNNKKDLIFKKKNQKGLRS